MNELTCPVYVFRSAGFAPAGNTVVSVAPVDCVKSVYDAEGGLVEAFGGAAVFEIGPLAERYIGVWGARNASRFRARLRAEMKIDVLGEAPAARLVFWSKRGDWPAKLASL